MKRRDFVKTGALLAAGGLIQTPRGIAQGSRPRRIAIQVQARQSMKVRLAARELLSGLRSLQSAREVTESSGSGDDSGAALILRVEPDAFNGDQEYEIFATKTGAILKAASDLSLLYAVFDFLERQGLVFGIDGTTVPIDRPPLLLPAASHSWIGSPRFLVRGLLPWPDFLNCISVYNPEDYQAYFAAMLRMRFNMFGMHVYSRNYPGPMAESYLSFDFAGSGHRAALEDTTMRSWGYLPQRTSTYKMGAAQFFDQETFGADATRLGAGIWEIADRTRELLRGALKFASDLGIRTGIGLEPYTNPAEIVAALPPEAISHPGGLVESRTGRALLERRLADLLERYPMVDYIWLWQDENHSWDGREKELPQSATPFLQAHDFLRRHAPGKKLVLAGWGGMTRYFESLHQKLPEDIVFSALNDSLGWDPVNEAFSKLGGRERWPIPWLEDDPSMWFPQFRAGHVQMDMQRAEQFGCQGVLGIHWRHRITDPTATYLARAGWDKQLTAPAHYRTFCSAMASGDRARQLADLFVDCDSKQAISSTFLGTYNRQGYANRLNLAADFDQAFLYSTDQPDRSVLALQRATADQFRALEASAGSATERNRIGYFSGYVNFMPPYCEAYLAAHQLSTVLDEAVRMRAAGDANQACEHILRNGVPLWLAIPPLTRKVMLEYQAIVATRNDQGQLASMQNKFVRIALERLRLSLQEFTGDLPASMEQAYNAAIDPGQANQPRIVVPTRPSLLKPGESLRLFIVALESRGNARAVTFYSRSDDRKVWQAQMAVPAGRSVYTAQLGPFCVQDGTVQYYASLEAEGKRFFDPPEAPENAYWLNILDERPSIDPGASSQAHLP